jgi:hypothetical protein
MGTFDCATCHNLKPSKMNNHNGRWISIFLKNPQKILIMPQVIFWWMDESDINTQCYGCSQKSCINWKRVVATKLQWIAQECDYIYNELHFLQLMQLVWQHL